MGRFCCAAFDLNLVRKKALVLTLNWEVSETGQEKTTQFTNIEDVRLPKSGIRLSTIFHSKKSGRARG